MARDDRPLPPRTPPPRVPDYARTAAALVQAGYDERHPDTHAQVTRWLHHALRGEARKGLLLVGLCGTGKTQAAESMHKLLHRTVGSHYVIARTLPGLVAKRDGELPDFVADYEGTDNVLIIDDMGTEEPNKHYGQTHDPMPDIIDQRVRLLQKRKRLTVLTTNLLLEPDPALPDVAAISTRYGVRTLSRLHELCNFVAFDGPDWRRAQGNEAFMQA